MSLYYCAGGGVSGTVRGGVGGGGYCDRGTEGCTVKGRQQSVPSGLDVAEAAVNGAKLLQLHKHQ